VTVQSTNGLGATVNIQANAASFIKFSNLTIAGGASIGCSKHMQYVNSTFTAGFDIWSVSCGGVSIDTLVDSDTFGDIGQATYEGRLSIRGDSQTSTIGVTVSNSHFGPGCQSDGINVVGDTAGLVIGPGNIFDGIMQSGPVHCDSIQFYSDGNGNIVNGNWFKNDSVALQHQGTGTEPSGTQFTNNIISNVNQVQVGNSANFVFEHNTIYNLTDVFRFNTEPSTGVNYRSNIVLGNTAAPPGGITGLDAYNLCSSSGLCDGTNMIIGTPTFVGGSPTSITTIAGWQLAAGSLGKNAGHDGQDVGVVFNTGTTPQAPSAPTNLRVVAP
jgi:hypothetical protein